MGNICSRILPSRKGKRRRKGSEREEDESLIGIPVSERQEKTSSSESRETSIALTVHQDGISSPSSALIIHQDGTSSPSSVLDTHQNETSSPSSELVVHLDGTAPVNALNVEVDTTSPSSALVVKQDERSPSTTALVVKQDETSPSTALFVKQDERSPSTTLVVKQNETSPSTALFGKQNETSPSTALVVKQNETPPSTALVVKQDETSPSTALVVKQNETPPSTALVVKQNETPPSTALVVKQDETSPSTALVVKQNETPPSTALVVKQDETPPSTALVVKQNETPPSTALVVKQNETPPSTALVVKQDETPPSTALVVKQDERSQSTTLVVKQDETTFPGSSQVPRTFIQGCSSVTCIESVTAGSVNIQTTRDPKGKSAVLIPGTLAQETLELRMAEAEEMFITTETFKKAQTKLDEFGHLTICGASGEGKTTIALMLAKNYHEMGYDIVFVERVDMFDFNQCISYFDKFILIVDDMFGTIGSSSEITQLKRLLLSLKNHIQMSRRKSKVHQRQERNREHDQNSEQLELKDIRVVFTSKPYNFNESIAMFEYEKLSFFKEDAVMELTGNKNYSYSKEEKAAIFEKYQQIQTAKEEVEFLWKVDKRLFGFPLTCRLYFDFPHLTKNGKDFFSQPLLYLKLELKYLLALRNEKSAALMLMVLCGNFLVLADLELKGSDPTLDQRIADVIDIVPAATRSGIAAAARSLTGTYFHGLDILSFTHSSVYDACSYVMYHYNQAFVLKYCSYDFLFERVRPGTETRTSEHLHFIHITGAYFDVFATKLAQGVFEGLFANTVTHPLLQNEQLVKILLEKLKVKSDQDQSTEMLWFHQKDYQKGFLYWAVLGHSTLLVREIEKETKIEFGPSEVIESLDGCVEKDNLELFNVLVSKLNEEYDSSLKDRLLLLSAECVSFAIAQQLVEDGADISAVNEDMQNYVHLACKMGKAKMLSYRVLQSFATDYDQQSALTARDINGRTPVMIAVLSGSTECFRFLKDVTDLDVEDKYGDSPLHVGCYGGHIDIVEQLLTSDNIDSRGEYGWTPLMNAAAGGHANVFQLLVSNNADLTLNDDDESNLLHLACMGGNCNIVQQILSNFDINQKDKRNRTPVMYAAAGGHHGVFDFLVSNNADLTLVDSRGNSLLHLACQGGNIDIVRHVLTPSDINSRGEDGWTPIMYAARNGHQRVFEFLVSNDADITLEPDSGKTLLSLACEGDNRDIIQHVLTPSGPPSTFLTDVHVTPVC